mmetsp:Transcript_44945/g.103907  ORF Transcript_44945/g.103907 Transcript_44945/m.103907 type:complete len:244 (-) Transcript_44945:7-738(-)
MLALSAHIPDEGRLLHQAAHRSLSKAPSPFEVGPCVCSRGKFVLLAGVVAREVCDLENKRVRVRIEGIQGVEPFIELLFFLCCALATWRVLVQCREVEDNTDFAQARERGSEHLQGLPEWVRMRRLEPRVRDHDNRESLLARTCFVNLDFNPCSPGLQLTQPHIRVRWHLLPPTQAFTLAGQFHNVLRAQEGNPTLVYGFFQLLPAEGAPMLHAGVWGTAAGQRRSHCGRACNPLSFGPVCRT